ncbi:MAG: SPOR domain-containing protein [Desulfuromonadaceae bacterium]|nr:SPOR domain-containing protein [Desulfuromonadaceae bacterium]
MAVVTLLVLVLCLASFTLGIMVGKSGNEEMVAQVPEQTLVSVGAQGNLEPSLVLTDAEAKQELRQQKPVRLKGQVESLHSNTRHTDVEKGSAAQIEDEVVVQEIPLGSGINPRKNGASATVGDVGTDMVTARKTESTHKGDAPAPAPAQAAAPLAAEQKTRAASSQVSAAKGGKYVVQIASFRAVADAQALAQKLQPEFPAYVREVDLDAKGKWFRVLVGPLAQREEADAVQRRIKQDAKLDGFVKRMP